MSDQERIVEVLMLAAKRIYNLEYALFYSGAPLHYEARQQMHEEPHHKTRDMVEELVSHLTGKYYRCWPPVTK